MNLMILLCSSVCGLCDFVVKIFPVSASSLRKISRKEPTPLIRIALNESMSWLV